MPTFRATATPIFSKRMSSDVGVWRLFPFLEGPVNPLTNGCRLIGPVINVRIGVIFSTVIRKPRWYQMRIIASFSKIRMFGQPDSEQAASGVPFCLSQTGAYLPVHVLPFPGTAANQNNRHGCVSNIVLTNSLQSRLSVEIFDVPGTDRPIHHIVFHHLD